MSSNSKVIAVPLQRGIRILAASRMVDAIFLLLQGSDETFREQRIIFDDKYAHSHFPGRRRRNGDEDRSDIVPPKTTATQFATGFRPGVTQNRCRQRVQ